MDPQRYRFYYSFEQIEHSREWDKRTEGKAAPFGSYAHEGLLDSGEVVEYTECVRAESDSEPAAAKCSDCVYLGEGVILNSQRIDRTLEEIERRAK